MGKAETPAESIQRQRRVLAIEATIAFVVAVLIWLGIYYFMPVIPGMETLAARFVFTLKLCCVVVLFCLDVGIEAIARERLQSAGIDPLSGYTSHRMTINTRYLQQTLEQLMLFIPGLFALAYYCSNGSLMRLVVAATVVWILSRYAFWIGYHRGPEHRDAGSVGMKQSMLVLLFVCGMFGYEIAGFAGAAIPIILFIGIEIFLLRATRPK